MDPSRINSVQSSCLALESRSWHTDLRCHKNRLTEEVKLVGDCYWKNDWQQDNTEHLWLWEMGAIDDCFFTRPEMVFTTINKKMLLAERFLLKWLIMTKGEKEAEVHILRDCGDLNFAFYKVTILGPVHTLQGLAVLMRNVGPSFSLQT